MPNYATAYDVWRCEPPDDSEAEARDQARREITFDDYIDDGWLPGNHDSSEVDALMTEQIPEALDGLITAKDDEALIKLAKQIRDTRIKVIEQIIADNLEA